MQINTQNIQRPTLFSEFFNKELIWNNEYLTYIQTTIKIVTSNICMIAKTTKDNIKKSLKENYYRYENSPLTLNRCQLLKFDYEDRYLFLHSKNGLILFVSRELEKYKDYMKTYKDFSIFKIATT